MRIFRCHKINEVIARGEKFFKGFSLFACRKTDCFSESKNIILYKKKKIAIITKKI